MLFNVTKNLGQLCVKRYNYFRVLQNIMSSEFSEDSSRREHEEITANQSRQENIFNATVTDVQVLSESVKGLKLKIDDDGFIFKAGQWVDFFIPGMKTFTGYTIASSPQQFELDKEFLLAIKYSSYPPTLWVHEKCRTSSEVKVRVGGDFYFPPSSSLTDVDLLLIAGGVGINPLMSILNTFFDANEDSKRISGSASLMYSSKTEGELLFKSEIDKIQNENSETCNISYFVTQEDKKNTKINYSRIDREAIRKELEKLQKSKLLCYICGPSTLIDNTSSILSDEGVEDSRIFYEKWW